MRKLLVLVLLGLSLAAAADFRTITEAYEVDLSDLRLPGSENGTLTFKQCADCESQTLRVTGKTRYLINDRDFALAEFKEQLQAIRNRKDQSVSVLHHLESNTIKAIKVWL
jgi:biopolymer transport protein ExbD